MKALIVVLAAPSGGGKTTIARALVARRRDVGFSVSATTRAPRPAEQDGEAYFFLSRAEFLRRRDAGEFLEWAEYAGELYGTLKAEVERLLRDGRHVLLDIEVQGARQVREQYPPPALVAIFILPPNGRELVRRLRGRRTESAAEIAQRLETAIRELRQAAAFDHVVINDGLEEAVAKVSSIIDSPFPAAGVKAMAKRIDTLIRELQAEAAQLRTSKEQQ